MIGLPITAPLGIARSSISLSSATFVNLAYMQLLFLMFLSTIAPGDLGPTGKVSFCFLQRLLSLVYNNLSDPSAWRGCQHLNELLNMQYFIPSIEPELTRIYELPSSSVSQEPKLSVSSSVTNDLSNDSKPSSATPTDGTSTTAVTNPDNEIDSQLLLHPDKVPNLISAFNLSSLAAAEILTAIEQAKSRIKKERKKQKS